MSAVRVWREGLHGMVEAEALYPGHQGYVLVEDYQSADAVMAQMAEALNAMMEYAGIIEERCDSVATNKMRKAISAYQSLGEQS